jgi:hypothetical protein
MDETDIAKDFVKRWARLTDNLYTCQAAVMSELANEPSAKQQAMLLYNESLGSSSERRVIALQLALATSPVRIADL